MKERFNETINSIIISSVLVFIIGLIMVLFPAISIETFGVIISTYIIMHGIILIYLDIKATKYYIPFDGFFPGILSILMGIFLLCKPNLLLVVFTIIIGMWMILSSINHIKVAIKLSHTKLPWLQILILGILDLIAGIVMIFNPFEATISLTLFAGVMIMMHSTITIFDLIIIKKDVNGINEALKDELKKITK